MSANPSPRASVQLSRIEIASERLPARRDPLRHLLMMGARRGICNPLGRVGVVEHDFRPARPAGEFAKRREHCRLGQVGHDAKPQHERGSVRVEPGGLKRGFHAAAFEIVSDVRDVRRFGDLRLGKPAAFFGLGRWMIELEDAQVPGRLEPIGEGVEAGAQDQDLLHAFFDRMGRRVLGETAAHGDEQAQRPPLRPFLGERDGALGVLAQDPERQRIGEDEPPLEDLMRRPVTRRAKRGHTCVSLLHDAKLMAERPPVERGKLDAENPLPYRPVIF
jgi:hypothetical protein